MILFTSFSMTYSTCVKSFIRKFRKENSRGRGWGIRNLFFGNLPSNLQKQAYSLCKFFQTTHQNFILIFRSCSFICAPLKGHETSYRSLQQNREYRSRLATYPGILRCVGKSMIVTLHVILPACLILITTCCLVCIGDTNTREDPTTTLQLSTSAERKTTTAMIVAVAVYCPIPPPLGTRRRDG